VFERFGAVWYLLRDRPEKEWGKRASLLLKDYPETFQAIEFADVNLSIKRVEPLEGNESILGLDIRGRPFTEDQIAEIGRSAIPRYAPPFDLLQGMRGMTLYVPVYYDGRFEGLAIAVFHLNNYLNNIVKDHEASYNIQLRFGEQIEYESPAMQSGNGEFLQAETTFESFGQQLTLRVSPTGQQLILLKIKLIRYLPFGGAALACLLALLSGLYVSSQEKSATLKKKTEELSTQIRIVKEVASALELSRGEAESKEIHLKAVFQAAPNGILLLDEEGNIRSINAAVERIFGYSESELIEEPIDRVVPDVRSHRALVHIAEPAEEVIRERSRELFGVHKNGGQIPVEVSAREVETAQGRFTLVSIMDISERYENKAKLERINRELRRSNEALDQFAYVASHDLKAPLRAIKNYATWLKEDAEETLSTESKAFLQKLQKRVVGMERLLDDVLSYAKIGRETGAAELIDSRALALGVAQLVAPPSGFTVSVDQDMPQLRALRIPLELVFRNLISNAIKHHDREAGTVSISGRVDKGMCFFSVSDDGPGIEKKFHEKIFKMFETLQPRDDDSGSGMGLAMVKKAIEAQGGVITCESTVGNGSVFHFTVPQNVTERELEQ
jgi:PAS domain S-box-containing protein